ncbi:MAG: nucleotide exchange factor GrpE [Eubacterium sp.]|nr:nucleotide exchange factor GrpE [Eubacterium sp.]
MAEEMKETKEANDTECQTETGENKAAADTNAGTGSETDTDDGKEAADPAETAEKEPTAAEDNVDADGKEAADTESRGKKEGIFKKKKSKEQEQIEELTDRVKRQMAEFDNFRKRTEKEKTQMFETGAKSMIEKILPVVDNFERGLAALSEEEKAEPFAEGMDKIYKQMMAVLTEAGVTPIEAEGKEFDPNLHNAVMHIDDENYGENIVVQELQKGYMYHDSVVRHSMVQVAN